MSDAAELHCESLSLKCGDVEAKHRVIENSLYTKIEFQKLDPRDTTKMSLSLFRETALKKLQPPPHQHLPTATTAQTTSKIAEGELGK
jgi:hypothetical protein